MDFLGIGGWEVLLILVVALIVWGPGRIAEIGRTLGKVARNLKKASFDLTSQLNREIDEQETKKPPTTSDKDHA
jgi:Tat protein translocase TatB subunit